MSRQYSAYDVSSFLRYSIGSLVSEIEGLAIDMMKEESEEERYSILGNIQEEVIKINEIIG